MMDQQYKLEQSRMRSISPINDQPVRFFGKDITNISRRVSPVYQNSIQQKLQTFSPIGNGYDSKIPQKSQNTVSQYPQTYIRQSIHLQNNTMSHNTSPQPLITRYNQGQSFTPQQYIPNQQNYLSRRNPIAALKDLQNIQPGPLVVQAQELNKSASFSRVSPSPQNHANIRGSNFENKIYSNFNLASQERKTSHYINPITSEDQNTGFLANLHLLENKATNQYQVDNIQNQPNMFGYNMKTSNPVKITDSPQHKVTKTTESNILRSSLNTQEQKTLLRTSQNPSSMSGLHQSNYVKVQPEANQILKNAIIKPSYTLSRQGSNINSLKNSYSNFQSFQDQEGPKISKIESITPIQNLQNRAFEHYRNTEVSQNYENQLINPFEQSKKNAEKLNSRTDTIIGKHHIENLSHLWLDNSKMNLEEKQDEQMAIQNNPVNRQANLEISEFNPNSFNSQYFSQVQGPRAQLQERLNRIDIRSYFKPNKDAYEETPVTVKLNKVMKVDSTQIQRVEESTYLQPPNIVSSNELTFSADQLKQAFQANQTKDQYTNQSHVHTYAVRIPQEILQFRNYAKRQPTTLEKYKVSKNQPGYKFKPEKLSSLAQEATSSATLPIQNIWNDLIFKIVRLCLIAIFLTYLGEE